MEYHNLEVKEALKKLYTLKFDFYTNLRYRNDTLIIIEPFISEETSKLELETYEEIINDLLNKIFLQKENIDYGKYWKKLILLIKDDLRDKDGKINPLEILENRYKLNLLLAISNNKLNIFYQNYDVIANKNIYIKRILEEIAYTHLIEKRFSSYSKILKKH